MGHTFISLMILLTFYSCSHSLPKKEVLEKTQKDSVIEQKEYFGFSYNR